MKTKSRRGLSLLAVAALAGFSVFAGSSHLAAADKGGSDAKLSIEDIMKRGFKGKEKSLLAAVVNGKATADQKKQFTGYCEALAASKPPKGDQADWDKRCKDILAAAKAVEGGDAKAGKSLQQAANCKACHDLHQDK